MANLFTSDLHFGHVNIIKYCNRPFQDTTEMDEALFKMLWSIPAGDTLWVLGDVVMRGKENAIKVVDRLAQIPIKIKIICGNHDKGRESIFAAKGLLEHRTGRHEYNIDGFKVSMGHFPVEEKNPRTGVVYLCGHIHDKWKFQTFGGCPEHFNINCNVGWDVWKRPVTLEEIVKERDEYYLNLFNK